jgi:hypothetical protein
MRGLRGIWLGRVVRPGLWVGCQGTSPALMWVVGDADCAAMCVCAGLGWVS